MRMQTAAGWDIHRKFSLLSVVQRSAEGEIRAVQHLAEDVLTCRLQTIPGIGLILAHVLRAEIGELVEPFPSRLDQPLRFRDR